MGATVYSNAMLKSTILKPDILDYIPKTLDSSLAPYLAHLLLTSSIFPSELFQLLPRARALIIHITQMYNVQISVLQSSGIAHVKIPLLHQCPFGRVGGGGWGVH